MAFAGLFGDDDPPRGETLDLVQAYRTALEALPPLDESAAAKAVALEEASRPPFMNYAAAIVANAQALAERPWNVVRW